MKRTRKMHKSRGGRRAKKLIGALLTGLALSTTSMAEQMSVSDTRANADAGDPGAMYNLGRWSEYGERGLRKNKELAKTWYEQSFVAGYPGAGTAIGEMFERDGQMSKAATWYERAGAAGDAVALNNLGWLYDQGHGVPKNPKFAMTLYRQAWETDRLPEAAFNIGVMYRVGVGTPPDPEQARVWQQRAAERNDPLAQYELCQLLYHGIGGSKRKEEGLEWCRAASAQGHEEARIFAREDKSR